MQDEENYTNSICNKVESFTEPYIKQNKIFFYTKNSYFRKVVF